MADLFDSLWAMGLADELVGFDPDFARAVRAAIEAYLTTDGLVEIGDEQWNRQNVLRDFALYLDGLLDR